MNYHQPGDRAAVELNRAQAQKAGFSHISNVVAAYLEELAETQEVPRTAAPRDRHLVGEGSR